MFLKVITVVISLSATMTFAQENTTINTSSEGATPVAAPAPAAPSPVVQEEQVIVRKSFAFTVTPDQVGTTVRFGMKGQNSASTNPNSVLNREFEVFIQSTNLNAGEKDIVTITAGEDLLDVTVNAKGYSNYKYNIEPKTADLVRIELVGTERIEKPVQNNQSAGSKDEKKSEDESSKAPVKKQKRSAIGFASL